MPAVMSYFEHYYNLSGEKTLRRYSHPANLSSFGAASPKWIIDS
jgi:hypothetical protein